MYEYIELFVVLFWVAVWLWAGTLYIVWADEPWYQTAERLMNYEDFLDKYEVHINDIAGGE